MITKTKKKPPSKKRDRTQELKAKKLHRKSLDLSSGVHDFFESEAPEFNQQNGKQLMEVVLKCLAKHTDVRAIIKQIIQL